MLRTPLRKLQSLLGLACIPALLTAAPAAAQDASDEAVSDTVKKEGDGDASDPEKEDEGDKNPFPLSASLGLDNSLGSGWISPAEPGRQSIPSFTQTLTPGLAFNVPKFGLEWMPNMSVSTQLSVSIEWMSTYYNTVYDRVPRLTDSITVLSFPGLYKEEVTGLSLSASLNGRLPVSLGSRRANVWGALGAGGALAWNSSKVTKALDLPEWAGTFSASIAPSVLVFGHTASNPTLPCGGSPLSDGVLRRGDAIETALTIPAVVPRDGEILDNGECIIPGRRVWMSASGATSLGWSSGKHSVNASLALIYSFMSPNQNQDLSLSSPNASGQDFGMPLTNGALVYSYQVPMESFSLPVDTGLSLSAGISSFQPAWNLAGSMLRFPFWDFVTPENNFSAAFLSANLSI